MPNIQEVADQINAKLDQITQNTALTAATAGQIRDEMQQANARLASIEGTLQAGFANLSQGLFAILEVQKVAVALLEHNRRQNDTIICELVNANGQLCGISRKMTRHIAVAEATQASVKRIEGIAEREHAASAGDYDRTRELVEKIEKCCPPEPPPVEPCPEPCDKADFRPRRPGGQDWEPLPTPDRQPPIG